MFHGVVEGRAERDALIRLTGRDLEPTPGSPLTYRERAYLLASPADRDRLEVLLQAELGQIRRELANKPRGQFVSLAVFDEPFQGVPSRPPLATLEWKDWKDSTVFALAAEHGVPDPTHSGLNGAVHAPAVARPPEPPPPAPPDGPSPSTPPSPPASLPPPAPILASLTTAPPAAPTPIAPTPPQAPVLSEPLISDGSGETDTRLAAAFEAMPELYFLSTPIAGLEFTIQLLLRLIPSEAISMCLYDINTDEFRFVTLTGPGAFDRRAGAVPSSAGLFGAAKRGEVLLVADAANEPRYDPQVDGRTGLLARNLAYAPVRQGGQVLGMVQLINREDDRGFTQDDVAIIAYVAKQLAEFLVEVRTLNE